MKLRRFPALVLLLLIAGVGTWRAQSGPPGPDTLLFESFGDGIPASWTVVDGHGDGYSWTTVDPTHFLLHGFLSVPRSAIANSRGAGAAVLDEQLVTPVIDVGACTAPVKMEFLNVFTWYVYGLSEVGDVDAWRGGPGWTNMLRMSGDDDGPNRRTVQLAEYPRNYSLVKARFRYYNAENEFWWLVDNVRVYCDCSGDVAGPVAEASPGGMVFPDPQMVTLSCADSGCGCRQIHYTLDGSEPTSLSPVYSQPIPVASDSVIKFFAVDFGGNRSDTHTEIYTILPPMAPTANAGPGQTVHVGTVVTLDGSQSTDPDGNYPLRYSWTLVTVPPGSHATLSDSAAVNPTFVTDVSGQYVAALTVRDQMDLESEPASVTISTSNSAPRADAGEPQTVSVGTTVTLAGSGTDPDGDAIAAFAWTMIRQPPGSSAVLLNPTGPAPSFWADVPGDYTMTLIVTDCWGRDSAPAGVTISTLNTPPVADAVAAPAFVTLLGTAVSLHATESYDPDGDTLTYAWAFKVNPSSTATLANADTVAASFVADSHGDYVVELTVWDQWGATGKTTVTVSFDNLPPVADPGANQAVNAGAPVTLDGTGSSDPNDDPLSYRWSLIGKPDGSSATLSGDQLPNATFTPDLPGAYTVQLIVSDGLLTSAAKLVTVTAIALPTNAVDKLTEAIALINALDGSAFKNKNMRNTLTGKIGVVVEQIRAGLQQEAIDKLVHDVLAKLDGCGVQPDGNDWVIACGAQWAIRPLIVEAIDALR